jgi:hypothetical protein
LDNRLEILSCGHSKKHAVIPSTEIAMLADVDAVVP